MIKFLIILMFLPISLLAQDSTLANPHIIKEHPLATNNFLQAKVAVEEEEYDKANEFLIEAIIIDSLIADYYDLLAFSAAKANDIELLNEAFKQAGLIYQSDHKIYFKRY